MTTPIIIGTDILNRDDITYVRTKDKQFLSRAVERVIHATLADEIAGINTPLQGVELERLVTLIKHFNKYRM